MQIKFNARFFDELNDIKIFIAKDSNKRADIFIDEILKHCLDLKLFPYACRSSKKVKSKNARDLIYKGYVIPYLIDDEVIIILGIYKANQWQF
ncbi:type II toxin-antitoxin system RelE/ParE family toxin [Campylobacter hyointestinalis]|uniref:type II toxin-antitoxin system RelE/ParE family toxin n=1 Tax=Campylobacter hyointestinalis TaxID=198 RepID=UPI0007290B5F|nr:type II toxin-antitoxin system RelE/ParE family toxin [Campylobacter hyointestinalis]MBT0611391.1 type II toxin-antitoxin system RelE/ParE family toxin [Campylobacter hyointestinalis subsp. hyointestinalis]PPB68498.1 RelE/ParE family toxin [Campylobacter hyointestinalis subsp. hyointestinalis]CUU77915.1 plasmid stabilization system protein [Campylobacter hyointestinalis subsp. hyointestinalis]